MWGCAIEKCIGTFLSTDSPTCKTIMRSKESRETECRERKCQALQPPPVEFRMQRRRRCIISGRDTTIRSTHRTPKKFCTEARCQRRVEQEQSTGPSGSCRFSSSSSQMHHISLPVLLLLVLCTSLAVAEDAEGDEMFDDNVSSRGDSGNEEWYMVLLFSLLFGFFITLFGAFVGYFSVLEDSLMRRYKREGVIVCANVVSSEFARGGGKVAIFTKQRDNPEYIAFVEYDFRLAEHYTVRVRKQVKAKASDFVNTSAPGKGTLIGLRLGISCARNAQRDAYAELGYPEDTCCGNADDWKDDADVSQVPASRELLELLVLPDHERSGYPRMAVERACGLRYRLSTLGLVVFDLALAAFCTRLAANDVLALEHDTHRIIGWYAIATFLVLIALEVPLIHCCCHQVFDDALKEEYLESGDYVPLPHDDSSLSSGSDMFLSRQSSRSYR